MIGAIERLSSPSTIILSKHLENSETRKISAVKIRLYSMIRIMITKFNYSFLFLFLFFSNMPLNKVLFSVIN